MWKQDEFWKSALQVAESLSKKHIFILVPEEFVSKRDEFYPVRQSKQLNLADITGFVIPKDFVECLPTRLLEDGWFRRFHCVWANEVFGAFSTLDEDVTFSENFEQHLPAFYERRNKQLMRGQDLEPLPVLLDTQQNRILKELFPHKKYVMEQFRDLSKEPMILRRETTKYCVSEVRIELSSYCNRSCSYCPVSFLDRKDKADQISKAVYEKCIDDLAKIEFSGQLWFCLFNEPLYDRDFLMYAIEYATEKLPRCFLKIVTNGDYLTEDYLAELADHKLNELAISVHYEGVWNREVQLGKIRNILDRIGLPENGVLDEDEGRIVYYVDPSVYNSRNIKSLTLRSEDFTIHGMDRGGTLSEGIYQMENLDSCPYIFDQVNISHDGKVVPCCNICSDSPGMDVWVFGNVQDAGGIFAAYTSAKAAAFRKHLFAPRQPGEHTPPPCRTCSEAHWDNTEKLNRIDYEIRREIRESWFDLT